MSRRAFALGIALTIGLQLVLGWIDARPEPRGLWGDEVMYRDAAVAVERGEQPELLGLWPPLYPRFVAWLVPTMATGTIMPAPVIWAQLVLLGLAAFALARFGEVALGDAAAARWAALAMTMSPSLAAFAHYLWPEILHLALFLGALALLARPRSASWSFLAGNLLGLAVLAKSLLVGFLPCLVLVVVWAGRSAARGYQWLRPCLASLGLGVVLLLAVGSGLAARDLLGGSGWFNAWVGLNDASRRNLVGEIVGDELAAYRASAATSAEREAIARRKVLGKVSEDGSGTILASQFSKQYFRLLGYDSFFTDMLPEGSIADQGFGYRMPAGWLSRGLRAVAIGAHVLLLLSAVWGALVLPWRERPWAWVVAAFVAYNLAIFLVLHVKTRYRVQFEPFLWLLAAFSWTHRSEIVERARASWTFVLAGACGSGLLLFLAFGRGLVGG